MEKRLKREERRGEEAEGGREEEREKETAEPKMTDEREEQGNEKREKREEREEREEEEKKEWNGKRGRLLGPEAIFTFLRTVSHSPCEEAGSLRCQGCRVWKFVWKL